MDQKEVFGTNYVPFFNLVLYLVLKFESIF